MEDKPSVRVSNAEAYDSYSPLNIYIRIQNL